MEKITQNDIEKATKRYADALVADMMVRQKVMKNEIDRKKTHEEVVLSFQDLQALRFQN